MDTVTLDCVRGPERFARDGLPFGMAKFADVIVIVVPASMRFFAVTRRSRRLVVLLFSGGGDLMVLVPVISIVISCGAFSFSLYAWRERIAQDRRDLYLRLHERLLDVELQHGRRILFRQVNSVADARNLFHGRPELYDLANMALAMLDTAALYVERGYIDAGLYMDEWGLTYKAILKHARYFLAERLERNAIPNTRPWVHFFSFAVEAAKRDWPEFDIGEGPYGASEGL
jgi:hypothetical protein